MCVKLQGFHNFICEFFGLIWVQNKSMEFSIKGFKAYKVGFVPSSRSLSETHEHNLTSEVLKRQYLGCPPMWIFGQNPESVTHVFLSGGLFILNLSLSPVHTDYKNSKSFFCRVT